MKKSKCIEESVRIIPPLGGWKWGVVSLNQPTEWFDDMESAYREGVSRIGCTNAFYDEISYYGGGSVLKPRE